MPFYLLVAISMTFWFTSSFLFYLLCSVVSLFAAVYNILFSLSNQGHQVFHSLLFSSAFIATMRKYCHFIACFLVVSDRFFALLVPVCLMIFFLRRMCSFLLCIGCCLADYYDSLYAGLAIAHGFKQDSP